MQIQKTIIVGIDESGRGPLFGPVVAAAVMVLSPKFKIQNLKDSKKLTPKRREEIYEFLKSSPEVEWGTGRVSEKVIDRINILQATKLAMKRAVKNLEKKIGKKVDFLLIDGNFKIPYSTDSSPLPRQRSIIKGDEKVFLIKLASIIAKVTRDRAMIRYHKKYPQYRLDKHKGYPTKLHFARLKKYGPCPLHRKTFKPIKDEKHKLKT